MRASHLVPVSGRSRLSILTRASLVALALAAPSLAVAAGSAKPAAPTNTVAAVTAQAEIPQSVFNIPDSPKEGRNPFFPQSQWGRQIPKPVHTKTDATDFSGFVLNGITSPPRQSAMINNRTFETGEAAEVKLPGGAKVLIKCVTIGPDSAVIECNGQRHELRLRSGI